MLLYMLQVAWQVGTKLFTSLRGPAASLPSLDLSPLLLGWRGQLSPLVVFAVYYF